MDFDRKDGHSYLDGVPVKISSKFLPPKKIDFPPAFSIELPSDLLQEEYDFSLERKVLESEQKQAAKHESSNGKSTAKDDSNQNTSAGKDLSLKANHMPWQPDIILQPKPQQQIEKPSTEDNDAVRKTKNINFSDFENDTSSPFDYVELQTINDLEELNNVFQGLNSKHSKVSENTENVHNSTDKTESISNVSKSISFPLPQNSSINATEKLSSTSCEDFAYKSFSVNEQIPFSDKNVPFIYSLDSHSFGGLKENETNNANSALPQVPYISSYAPRYSFSDNKELYAAKSNLRGCKSYSDIHSLSETADANCFEQGRSRTPPSSLNVMKAPELICDHMSSKINCDNTVPSICGLPDPYDELDEASKKVVDSITDMGFSRGQVARTVKHLGTDEKEVIDHLCQIQSFEEAGYDNLEAEAALHLHDYNKDQAKKFLDLVNQFQDLGFEKNAVKKALVQNKNDWNKTIDALLH